MEKNTVWEVVLSTLFLIVWWLFMQPQQRPVSAPESAPATAEALPKAELVEPPAKRAADPTSEQEVVVESKTYKAVFTTRGAAIKHWYLKENGRTVDLVLTEDAYALSTFPELNFTLSRQEQGKVVFSARDTDGARITKTYELSNAYLHRVTIETSGKKQPQVSVLWYAGLGTDEKEMKENLAQTRVLTYPFDPPRDLTKVKPGEHNIEAMRWVAIDNRYFLASFIFPEDGRFSRILVAKESKNVPPTLALFAKAPQGAQPQSYSFQVYLGPKGYTHLKTLDLRLEETVDFGFFGFLGKLVLQAMNYFHSLTGNWGWAIVILTVILQIIVFPLSVKSFKASIAMKKLQPHIKILQEKYKKDPQRLNMEMMNLYKTQKVNPLGGCLPMLLQLPIFWALFTTLRNAYELRGAPWMLWIQDLSAPDTLLRVAGFPLNVMPLVMGVGMFFQQKMMGVTTDPSQKMMMYMMPVLFTFIFWNFPSGLVLYWLINNIMTLSEQYVIMKKEEAKA